MTDTIKRAENCSSLCLDEDDYDYFMLLHFYSLVLNFI